MSEEREREGWPTEAHIKFAVDSLDRFSDWARFADAKAGAVIVVLGLALSDLLQRAGPLSAAGLSGSRWGVVATVGFWVACVLATATTISVIAALFPKATPGEESLAYFGDVARAPTATDFRRT